MSWFYSQSAGTVRHGDELVDTNCYAGKGECKNKPEMQHVHNMGPLPRGKYRMGVPVDHPHCGHFAIPLMPDMNNQMFGRSGFYWHGESKDHPGEASDGCPVSDLATRQRAWSSGDHDLEVVA